MNLSERIREIFNELSHDIVGLKGVIVSTMDGLPVVSDIKSPEEQNRIAAIVSSLTILSRKVAPQLEVGKAEDLLIEGEDGKIFCYTLGDDAILALITDKNVNLGIVRMKLPVIKKQLEELIL